MWVGVKEKKHFVAAWVILGLSWVLSQFVRRKASVLLSLNSWLPQRCIFKTEICCRFLYTLKVLISLSCFCHPALDRRSATDTMWRRNTWPSYFLSSSSLCWHSSDFFPHWRGRRGQPLGGLGDQCAGITLGQLALFVFASLIYNQWNLFRGCGPIIAAVSHNLRCHVRAKELWPCDPCVRYSLLDLHLVVKFLYMPLSYVAMCRLIFFFMSSSLRDVHNKQPKALYSSRKSLNQLNTLCGEKPPKHIWVGHMYVTQSQVHCILITILLA